MLYISILEDDSTYSEIIKSAILELFPNEFEIRIYSTTKELQDSKTMPDILISDIKLENENAINFASTLNKKNSNIQIIFISAYHNYAQDIFTANPVYYIQKPLDKDVLKLAIEKAINNLSNERNNTFTIKINSEIISVKLENISYFESNNRKITCHTNKGNYEFYDKLSKIESKLGNNFLRCHQSYIINMNKIESFTSTFITLKTGEKIPISQTRQKDVRSRYTLFLAKSI